MSNKTIMHIPHASTRIPQDVRGQFVLDDQALRREQVLMTDSYTDELFGGLNGCDDLVFPVSRLVVDPERFANDADEPMAAIGMGAVYEVMSDLQPLRRLITGEERERLMASFYRPHHDKLAELARPPKVRRGRAKPGGTLIIDAHSFPSAVLPYEQDQTAERPEICIGTDMSHTPDDLSKMAVSLFSKAGFTVAVNTPFAGAIVPAEFYQRDMRIGSLMIEVRRDLYMNEETGEKLEGFGEFRSRLRGALETLISLHWSRAERLGRCKRTDNELYKFCLERFRRAAKELAGSKGESK